MEHDCENMVTWFTNILWPATPSRLKSILAPTLGVCSEDILDTVRWAISLEGGRVLMVILMKVRTHNMGDANEIFAAVDRHLSIVSPQFTWVGSILGDSLHLVLMCRCPA